MGAWRWQKAKPLLLGDSSGDQRLNSLVPCVCVGWEAMAGGKGRNRREIKPEINQCRKMNRISRLLSHVSQPPKKYLWPYSWEPRTLAPSVVFVDAAEWGREPRVELSPWLFAFGLRLAGPTRQDRRRLLRDVRSFDPGLSVRCEGCLPRDSPVAEGITSTGSSPLKCFLSAVPLANQSTESW